MMDNKLCKGIDSIDLGTTLPKYPICLGKDLEDMQNIFNSFNLTNPKKKENQSLVRLFYSWHSYFKRKELITGKWFLSPIETLKYLKEIEDSGIDIILHQILLKDINDNENEIFALKNAIQNVNINPEIRILRYNECENSPFKETDKFNELVKMYSGNFDKVKYQISAGSEIKASCGQFICKEFKK